MECREEQFWGIIGLWKKMMMSHAQHQEAFKRWKEIANTADKGINTVIFCTPVWNDVHHILRGSNGNERERERKNQTHTTYIPAPHLSYPQRIDPHTKPGFITPLPLRLMAGDEKHESFDPTSRQILFKLLNSLNSNADPQQIRHMGPEKLHEKGSPAHSPMFGQEIFFGFWTN